MENFAGTFAGFSFPQTIAMLARGPLSKRLEEFKRTHGKRVCGPYYRSQPSANPDSAFFYLESDFMPSLRWEWADEVDGSRIKHRGWYTDDYGLGEKIRGLVMRLPHGRGFLAGWSMGKSMASEIDYTIWDDAIDCARNADRMAERAAENAREQEREFQEEQEREERDECIADGENDGEM
jgi:hypothetical protein